MKCMTCIFEGVHRNELGNQGTRGEDWFYKYFISSRWLKRGREFHTSSLSINLNIFEAKALHHDVDWLLKFQVSFLTRIFSPPPEMIRLYRFFINCLKNPLT